jgi:hypothetical protein
LLSNLGPGFLAYVEPAETGDAARFSSTVVLGLGQGPEGVEAGRAVDNALRTALALHALDEKNEGGRLRVEERKAGQTSVTTLNESTPFAFAVHNRRVIWATTPSGVVRALGAQSDPTAGERLQTLRAANFPEAESFLCVDLRALQAFAENHRPGLIRRFAARHNNDLAQATNELDQGLALVSLLDAAFLTTRIDPGFKSAHQTVGIVARPVAADPKP